jgi:hypothetical protein
MKSKTRGRLSGLPLVFAVRILSPSSDGRYVIVVLVFIAIEQRGQGHWGCNIVIVNVATDRLRNALLITLLIAGRDRQKCFKLQWIYIHGKRSSMTSCPVAEQLPSTSSPRKNIRIPV